MTAAGVCATATLLSGPLLCVCVRRPDRGRGRWCGAATARPPPRTSADAVVRERQVRIRNARTRAVQLQSVHRQCAYHPRGHAAYHVCAVDLTSFGHHWSPTHAGWILWTRSTHRWHHCQPSGQWRFGGASVIDARELTSESDSSAPPTPSSPLACNASVAQPAERWSKPSVTRIPSFQHHNPKVTSVVDATVRSSLVGGIFLPFLPTRRAAFSRSAATDDPCTLAACGLC